MSDELVALRRRKYLQKVAALFPDGNKSIDMLCESVARLLDCDRCSLSLVSDRTVFSIASYKVPVRMLDYERDRPFVSYEQSEIMEVTDDVRRALHLDIQGFNVEYVARVPVLIAGVAVGDLIVACDAPRETPLTESQWRGFKAAVELAAQMMTQSVAIRSHLMGLADLIVD